MEGRVSDFRQEIYNYYVSRFKSSQLQEDENQKRDFFRWADRCYGKLLEPCARDIRILEIGCGPGTFLEYLTQMGFSNAFGIDVSPEQIELAKKKGLNVGMADVFTFLEDSRECYDMIVAIDVIEHFTKEELLALFPLFSGRLTSGGKLIVQTVNASGLFSSQIIYGDLTHVTIFNEQSMSQLLRLFHFRNLAFYETGPFALKLTGAVRAVLWKLIRFFLSSVKKIQSGKSQQIWTETFICIGEKGEQGIL